MSNSPAPRIFACSMLTLLIAFGIVQSVLIRSKKHAFTLAG